MRYFIPLLMPIVIFARTMTETFIFPPHRIVVTRIYNYDLISLPGHFYTSEPGSPCLPRANYTVLLPPTAEITSVEVISCKAKDLPGSFNIFPAQKPMPLSLIDKGMDLIPPNPVIYNSSQEYPGKLTDFTPSGCLSGYRLANISLYHLQYIPSEKRLKFYREITIKIN